MRDRSTTVSLMTDIHRGIEVTVCQIMTAPAMKRAFLSLSPLDMPAARTSRAGVGLGNNLFSFLMRTRFTKAGSPIAVHTQERVLVLRKPVLFQKAIDWPPCSSKHTAMLSPVSPDMFDSQKTRITFSTAGTEIAISCMSLIPQFSVEVLPLLSGDYLPVDTRQRGHIIAGWRSLGGVLFLTFLMLSSLGLSGHNTFGGGCQ